jgi:hypothetical protein
MNKKYLMIIAIVILILLVGAGGFWGGVTYKTNQDSQLQARFFDQRGGSPTNGQITEGMQFLDGNPGNIDQAQGAFRSGGITGQIKSIEGDVLTISTAQEVATVTLSSETIILISIEGSTSDLEPGVRVMVMGEQDDRGNIIAKQITIGNNDGFVLPERMTP